MAPEREALAAVVMVAEAEALTDLTEPKEAQARCQKAALVKAQQHASLGKHPENCMQVVVAEQTAALAATVAAELAEQTQQMAEAEKTERAVEAVAVRELLALAAPASSSFVTQGGKAV